MSRRGWRGRMASIVVLALALCAGVSVSVGAWKIAEPGRAMTLPADHASHPDYKIEWWYYTGNVDTRDGRRLGFQVTFFRVGVDEQPASASRWALRDLYMAHFAVSDIAAAKFHVFDRLQRTGAGWAGAATDRLSVWNGDWSVRSNDDGSQQLHAVEKEKGLSLDVRLTNTGRWVAHGRDGYSQKGREVGNASHYYSLPRLTTNGTIAIEGQRYDVSGLTWMDHEFGSSVLEADQIGWDWFGLQLEDGRDLMLYQMRRRDGSIDPFSSGTLIARDGSTVHLSREDYTLQVLETWRSPATNATYPIRWRVTIPAQHLAFEVRAAMRDQELNTPHSTGVTYWEGAVDVAGDQNVRGRGYLELTGYNGVPLSDSLK